MGRWISSPAVKILILVPPIVFYMILFLDAESVRSLTKEDGLIQYMGALFFLFCSIIFLICFRIKRSIFYLFFGMLFLFGFLEEVSWGQRIIGYETPNFFHKYNLQDEFNIHNLKWFHGKDVSGAKKGFWGKLLNMDRLFSIFWLSYCVALPVLYRIRYQFSGWINKYNIPIVPLSLGMLFLLNYLVSKGLELWIPSLGTNITEIKETNFAFLFILFSVSEFIRLLSKNESATSKTL